SKEMGLVFEFAFCGVRLPGCVGKCGRRAGVVSGRPRGAARRQRGDLRSACGVPTARLVATRSELLVTTRHALGRRLPRVECGRVPTRRRGRTRAAFDENQTRRLGACTEDAAERGHGAAAGDASATAGRRGTANPDAAERSRGVPAGDASATAARGGTEHRRATEGSRGAPAGDVTAAGRRRKTRPEAAARSHGASARDAASGRGTARSQTCGRGAATRGRSEETGARGTGRETTAHQ